MSSRDLKKGTAKTSSSTNQTKQDKHTPIKADSSALDKKTQNEAAGKTNGSDNPEADIPSSKTGLTPRQVEAVQQSWERIGTEWRANGVDFFMRLFETFPYLLVFFKSLRDIPQAQMKISPKLRYHTITFKMGIDSFVDNLDDPSCLEHEIQKISDNHFARGLRIKQFKEALGLFIEFIKDLVELDAFTLSSWEQALAVVAKLLEADLKKIDEESNSGV